MSNNTLARIENHFIFNAQHGLSAREQKVILFLISQINPLDKQFEMQIVPLKEIQDILLDKRSGSFYEQMMNFADRMTDKKISFDTSVKFRGKKMKGYINWFSSIIPIYNELGDTCIQFLFSKDLKPFLLELKQYSQIDYAQVMPLGSSFSIRMYQVFRGYRDKMSKHQKRSVINYDLQELRTLLGVVDKYKDWRNFNRRVIGVIEDELKQTDIRVKPTPIRKGRKVTGIKFEIWDKGNRSTPKAGKLKFDTLTFSQRKAYQKLVGYSIADDIAMEMIGRVGGSELIGFEDWYFDMVLSIFESKTRAKSEEQKAGTLVNWFLKKKIFDQGDHFAKIMEQLQARKKKLQDTRPEAWDNRLLAKTMTSDEFTNRYNQS